MTMRVLQIDDEAKAEVARVLAHAEANPYFPGQASPGNDPKFVAQLGTFRTVFTYTHADSVVYRHLSVSVPGGKFPNVIAAFTIAELYGFTGWSIDMGENPGADWLVEIVEQPVRNICLGQSIASLRLKSELN